MGRVSDARERIVRAAARLFLTRSFQEVSVEEVCELADVRRGSFYYYFPSKLELVKAVIDLHAAALWDALDHAGGASAADRMFAIGDAFRQIQSDFEKRHGRVVGCPFGNLAAELSTLYPEVREYLAAVFQEIERRLGVACRAVAQEGGWRDGVDPDELARSLNAFMQGTILLAKVHSSSAASIGSAFHALVAVNLKDHSPAPAR